MNMNSSLNENYLMIIKRIIHCNKIHSNMNENQNEYYDNNMNDRKTRINIT